MPNDNPFKIVGNGPDKWQEFQANYGKPKEQKKYDIDFGGVAQSRLIGPNNSDTIPPLGVKLPHSVTNPVSQPSTKKPVAKKTQPAEQRKNVTPMSTIKFDFSGGGPKLAGSAERNTPGNFSAKQTAQISNAPAMGENKSSRPVGDYSSLGSKKEVRQAYRSDVSNLKQSYKANKSASKYAGKLEKKINKYS